MTLTVSIVIPTYNRPGLLRRAVQSALAACPSDGEVIVVDDGSDTASGALAELADDKRLRITNNAQDKGASGARNTGIAAARNDIILFLDDDDELVANYPARILNAARSADIGFGFSTITVNAGGSTRQVRRDKLKRGVQGPDVPLELKTAGLGQGFWVKRSVMQDIGPIAPDQVNDEDTDLCCRLYGQGHNAWFEDEPGCIVYQDYGTDDDTAPQLTRSTAPKQMAACYMRTFQRNQAYYGQRSADRWFLLRRALRAAGKTGADAVGRELLAGLAPLSWRIRGWVYWQIKRAGRRLR